MAAAAFTERRLTGARRTAAPSSRSGRMERASSAFTRSWAARATVSILSPLSSSTAWETSMERREPGGQRTAARSSRSRRMAAASRCCTRSRAEKGPALPPHSLLTGRCSEEDARGIQKERTLRESSVGGTARERVKNMESCAVCPQPEDGEAGRSVKAARPVRNQGAPGIQPVVCAADECVQEPKARAICSQLWDKLSTRHGSDPRGQGDPGRSWKPLWNDFLRGSV